MNILLQEIKPKYKGVLMLVDKNHWVVSMEGHGFLAATYLVHHHNPVVFVQFFYLCQKDFLDYHQVFILYERDQ